MTPRHRHKHDYRAAGVWVLAAAGLLLSTFLLFRTFGCVKGAIQIGPDRWPGEKTDGITTSAPVGEEDIPRNDSPWAGWLGGKPGVDQPGSR